MQKITPFLWYNKEAREAAQFYVEVFGEDSKIVSSSVMENTPSGTVEIFTVSLRGTELSMMSAGPLFKFSEAISFVINCKNQEEADYFTNKLSAVPEAEQCGWLKDKFGVSWQIVPEGYEELMKGPREKVNAVTALVLTMKRIDIKALKDAYDAA